MGDVTYHAGAQIDSHMRSTLAELYYSYSFINNGDLEFGLGLGVSSYWNAFEISGSGSISGGGQSGSASFSTESRNLVAPIPAIKAYFTYALFPRFFVRAAYKGITGTVDWYHGEMNDFRGGLDYFFTQNVGVGALYQYTKMSFSHAGEALDLAIDYKYSGPLVYVGIAF